MPYYDLKSSGIINNKYYSNFLDSLSQIKRLFSLQFSDIEKKLINKMLYINTITILEVYLSDSFINCIYRKKDYLKNFVSSFPDIANRKISMSEYFDIDINQLVYNSLHDVLYHDLSKVEKMFRATFNIDFTQKKEIRDFIWKSILTRHDLVHRNGKNKNNEEINILDSMLNDLFKNVSDFVNVIDFGLTYKVLIKKEVE